MIPVDAGDPRPKSGVRGRKLRRAGWRFGALESLPLWRRPRPIVMAAAANCA
jgi:hypothetical protein